VLDEPEELEIVDERAIGQDDVDVEGKALEDLHFRDDEGFFEVVKGLVKVEHGAVDKGRWAVVGGSLEQHVVHVDEITHAQGRLLELGGEEEGAHADVLVESEQAEEEREKTRPTATPKCFIELTYQNRWKRIWAAATATCFLEL